MTGPNRLVSVIIPCYNQAHFLGQAIESVLRQDYPHFEVIVVDDGSSDNTLSVAARYPGVHIIHQEHQGISAARNRGLHHSTGSYLVFLDSDDRLLPHAFTVGIKHLLDHAGCAFVFGHYREIAADGSLLSTPAQRVVDEDFFRQLLLYCYIYTPSMAMFRRTVFETVEGFNPRFKGAEDYDLYLRITKTFPIFGYGEIIAEYRRHAANMTGNGAQMLKACLDVLREQQAYVRGNEEWEEACQAGIRNYRRFWGERVVSQVWARLREGKEYKRSLRDMMLLLRYGPEVFPRQLGRKIYRSLATVWNHREDVPNS